MPTLPPPPPTESPAAAPARRRRLWPWLLGAIAVLLVLPPLLVAGLAFSARDSAGLQRLAGWASRLSGDTLSIGGAQGDLLSRFTLTDIRVHTRYTDVDLSRLTLDWQPRALWQRELRIDTLALGALKLAQPGRTAEPAAGVADPAAGRQPAIVHPEVAGAVVDRCPGHEPAVTAAGQ